MPGPRDGPDARQQGALDEEDEFCELLQDAYLRTDQYGVIRRMNVGAAELLGRDTIWATGKPLASFVEVEHRRAFRALVNSLATSCGAERWLLQLRTSRDELLTAVATVSAIRGPDGAVTGARWLLRRNVQPELGDVDHAPVAPAVPVMSAVAPDRGSYYAEFLARAGSLLGASLDPEVTLRSLARLAVPALGDWCMVDLVGDDGALRRLAVTGPPNQDATLAPQLTAWAPRPDGPDPAAAAVRTGRAQLVREPQPEWLATLACDPAHLAALSQLGVVSWAAYPLVARGQKLGAVTLLIGDSRRPTTQLGVAVAEELVRRAALSADNARLYRMALRASEAKSAFLATMSHELRTPLTAVMGYAELLRDGLAGELNPRQDQFVHRIRESSDHLLRLVEQVLDFARLEAREERAHLERVELGSLLGQATALVEPLARQKGLDFQVEHAMDVLWLRTDPTKLLQVLLNLLGNAVKFTDRGRVTLRVEMEQHGEEERVHFHVIDSGVGIPTAALLHIFDPFWQVEQTASRARGGAGLGLSVVRHLARLLGGDVAVESDHGRGSHFDLWIPRLATLEPEPDASAPPEPALQP